MQTTTAQWEHAASQWLLCNHCKAVFNKPDRSLTCCHCGNKSQTALHYFPHSITQVLQLISSTYRNKINIVQLDRLANCSADQYPVSLVLLFSLLNEQLNEHLTAQLAQPQNMPQQQTEAILKCPGNNQQALEYRWTTIAGLTWLTVITELGKQDGYDYVALDQRIKKLLKLAASFTYRGHPWTIDKNNAILCKNSLEPLLHLHVSLHNRYISATEY